MSSKRTPAKKTPGGPGRQSAFAQPPDTGRRSKGTNQDQSQGCKKAAKGPGRGDGGKVRNRAGRPSKKDAIHYEGLRLCYLKGFTDEETALALQITRATLHNWQVADPGFFDAIKKAKAEHDQRVERSLLERATGYSCPETRAQWVGDSNGGRWEYAQLTKHYPPDPVSMIFWLKNRQPKRWREKQDININGSVDLTSGLTDDEREAMLRVARSLALELVRSNG